MAYRKLTYEPDPLCIKCGHLRSKHTATHTDRPLCLACPEGWCVTAGATSEEITGAIASAIREHDFAAVSSLLKLLAVRDPHRAGVVYGAMLAVLDGHGKDAPREEADKPVCPKCGTRGCLEDAESLHW